MQSPRTAVGIALALLVPLAIAILLATYATPEAADAGARDGTTKIGASLVEALAEGGGEVSVIVSLRSAGGPGAPQVALPEQVERTREAQARVLSAIPSDNFRVSRRYDVVPALAGTANARAIDALATHPDVVAVSLDLRVEATLAEAVPLINADDLHALGITGKGVVAAVLDTGIDTDHPDLADDLRSEHCFLTSGLCHNGRASDSGAGAAEDDNSHGSHVIGIITSAGSVAPVGVAPDTAIRAYKVLNSEGTGFFSDILAAYDHIIATYADVDVINMSIGDGGSYTAGTCEGIIPALTAAIATTRSMGMTTFAGAGNSGSKSGLTYPGCINDVVSVGAVYDDDLGLRVWSVCLDASTAADQVTCFSQSNVTLDLLAPGSSIISAVPGGGSGAKSGTSMSSPAAAGAAALLLESEPLLAPSGVESRLEETGVALIDPGNGVTTCRIDIYEAVIDDGGPVCSSAPAPTPTTTLTPTVTLTPTFGPTPTITNTPVPATITVNTTNDELNSDGDCSLREAIEAANTDVPVDACVAGTGSDTIVVPAGTYTTVGSLTVSSDLTIDGAGAAAAIVDLNGAGSVFVILAGTTVEISGLTIQNGLAARGGGIYSEGTLTVNNSIVSGSTAVKGGGIFSGSSFCVDAVLTVNNSFVSGNSSSTGGGIFQCGGGMLTLNNSTVSGNTTAGNGGGIFNWSSGSTLTSSTVIGNTASGGGGIFNFGSNTLTLDSSTVTGNTADNNGGGIYNAGQDDTLTLNGSTVTGNTAGAAAVTNGGGGGIFNGGTLTLDSSTVSDNTADANGGGIRNSGESTLTNSIVSGNAATEGGGIRNSGTLTLNSSTVSGNTVIGTGGGIFNRSQIAMLTLNSSTVSGNTAGTEGGGIYQRGTSIVINNSTVSGNTAGTEGGGIYEFDGPSVVIKNTIVANNAGGDCFGSITSAGHNLIEDTTGCAIGGDTTGNIIGADPLLVPLGYGGPTEVHALLIGSPAVDAGSSDCPPPAADQRGIPRPFDGDGDTTAMCDIGSYEQAGAPPTFTPTATPTATPTPCPTAFCTPTPTATPTPCPTASCTPTPTVTPTPCPSAPCTPTPTAMPTKQPDPGDTDQDGCTDQAENGPNEYLGGQRDYLYFWDYYDVWTHPLGQPTVWVRDGVVNLPGDIIGTASRFGPGTAQTKEDALAAALTPPVSDSGYHAAFDRGPVIGANNWNRAPADGAINIPDDIIGVAVQFGHNCL